MKKNDPKTAPPRLQAVVVRGVLALVLLGLLLVPVAVQAELKAVSLAYTWDLTSNQFEWGHATVMFDGTWKPLLQEVYFDRLEDRERRDGEPEICEGHDLTVQYAGWIEYGLPYLDNDPEDARGFLQSGPDDLDEKQWILIDCDLNGDGTWNRDDLAVKPEDVGPPLAICTPTGGTPAEENCEIRYKDQVQDPPEATSEHVKKELATQLVIKLDTDCDGVIEDDPITQRLAEVAEGPDATGLCVYSWALAPAYNEGEIWWSFPLPVRITDADGAKTLMLYPVPTAVELASFNAEPQGRDVLVSWETAAEIDNVGFNVYRSKAGGERIRLNDWLIPSQSPGSTVGSRYQFVDRSAEPGTAYEYWLEDIDGAGAAGMNGPLAVQTPRYRHLPSRPRPAPMPQIQ